MKYVCVCLDLARVRYRGKEVPQLRPHLNKGGVGTEADMNTCYMIYKAETIGRAEDGGSVRMYYGCNGVQHVISIYRYYYDAKGAVVAADRLTDVDRGEICDKTCGPDKSATFESFFSYPSPFFIEYAHKKALNEDADRNKVRIETAHKEALEEHAEREKVGNEEYDECVRQSEAMI